MLLKSLPEADSLLVKQFYGYAVAKRAWGNEYGDRHNVSQYFDNLTSNDLNS